MPGQGTAIGGLRFIEPFPTIVTQRLVPRYALREQQSFDPVDVQNPFVGQYLTLTAKTAPVLFLGGQRLDHRAHPRLAALICQQCADQCLAVDTVSLRPTPPTPWRNLHRAAA